MVTAIARFPGEHRVHRVLVSILNERGFEVYPDHLSYDLTNLSGSVVHSIQTAKGIGGGVHGFDALGISNRHGGAISGLRGNHGRKYRRNAHDSQKADHHSNHHHKRDDSFCCKVS